MLLLEVYEVHRETLDETLQESISIDISSLLFPKDCLDVSKMFLILTAALLLVLVLMALRQDEDNVARVSRVYDQMRVASSQRVLSQEAEPAPAQPHLHQGHPVQDWGQIQAYLRIA